MAFKAMNSIHRVILKATGGRLGNNLLNMPVVELTVTGRKSGQPRTTMLTTPLELDNGFVLVASKGGVDRHPDWYLNLEANPEVEVALSGKPARPAVARITSGEERAELWDKLTSKHRNYAGYQRKTDREIPVIVVEPAGTGS